MIKVTDLEIKIAKDGGNFRLAAIGHVPHFRPNNNGVRCFYPKFDHVGSTTIA
jgi:hypothetical protein